MTVLCNVLDVVALAVGVALAVRLEWRGAAGEALRWTAFGGGVLLLAFVLTRPLGGFAALRALAHAAFCVVLPTFAVRAACVFRHSRAVAAAFALAFVVGEACYVFAREVEPFDLEVTSARIRSGRLAALSAPVRVACVADLQTDHIGAYEIGVFDRLVALQPDLVLFLGDYLQLPADEVGAELPRLHAQLRRLSPPLGMYAVEGDVDGPAGGARGVFAGTAVRAIDDASVALDGAPIDVVGLGRMRSRAPFADVGLVRRLGGERFPIVVGHAPDFMLSVLQGGLDVDALMVAGHTHGGQVQVPGLGPLLTLSSVPRWLAGGGVFQRGRTWLCCSRGIGMERDAAPRIRFCCRPQLLVLELSGPEGPTAPPGADEHCR